MADKLKCRRKKLRPRSEEEKAITRAYFAAGDGYERLMQMFPGRSDKAIFAIAEKMGGAAGATGVWKSCAY
ncbi:TPA: hypothetical protein N2G30_004332 [Salmonella enterica]|nr:hypothetical protein [Salmonella enterica]